MHVESGDRPTAQCLILLQSQVVNAKKKFLEEIESATPVSTWVIRKHCSFIADMGKVSNGLGRISNEPEYPPKPRPNTEQCPNSLHLWEGWGRCRKKKKKENIWNEDKSVHQD